MRLVQERRDRQFQARQSRAECSDNSPARCPVRVDIADPNLPHGWGPKTDPLLRRVTSEPGHSPLDLLRRLPARVALHVLGEALAHADTTTARSIANHLIGCVQDITLSGAAIARPSRWSRGLWSVPILRARAFKRTAESLDLAAGVVFESWRQIPHDQRHALVALLQDKLITRCGHERLSPDPRRRMLGADVAAFISPLCGAEHSALLLADPDPEVVSTAERRLARVSLAASGLTNATFGCTPEQLDEAAGVLLDAAANFGVHRSRGTLSGAILSARALLGAGEFAHAVQDHTRPVRDWLDSLDDEALAAARVSLRSARCDFFACRAVQWLASERYSAAAIHRLSTARSPGALHASLSRWHLCLRPLRAAALSKGTSRGIPKQRGRVVAQAPWALPTPAEVASLDAQQGRALAMQISPGGVAAGHAAKVRADLATHTLEEVRLALAVRDPSPARESLFDPSPRVSRAAYLRWSAAGALHPARAAMSPHRTDELRRLANICHDDVRHAARRELGLCVPGSILETGRFIRRIQSSGGLEEARRQVVTTPDPCELLLAIKRSGKAAQCIEELCQVVHGSVNPRAVAIAVSALGSLPGIQTRSAISAALSHSEPRVRANAVEAAGRRSVRWNEAWPLLISLREDPSHRVRANLIRVGLAAGFDQRRRLDELGALLASPSLYARAAGGWVAERLLSISGVKEPKLAVTVYNSLIDAIREESHPAPRARIASAIQAAIMVGVHQAGGGDSQRAALASAGPFAKAVA